MADIETAQGNDCHEAEVARKLARMIHEEAVVSSGQHKITHNIIYNQYPNQLHVTKNDSPTTPLEPQTHSASK